jgi:hypothetical protein
MNQIVQATEQKKLYCFGCGKEIIFKGTRQRFNVDGTQHVCNQQEKEQHKQQGQSESNKRYSKNTRYWRWYWSVGPGAYHKRNEKRYSSEDYKQRRKAAEENYNNYKQRYSNPESNVTEYQALEILGLTKEILSLKFAEKIQAIKAAFRTLALKFHPDRKPEGNATRFIEINGAYECLMNKHNGGGK